MYHPNVGNGRHPMICAVGLEFRDYPILMTAVKDLDVNLHIAASSAPAFYLASTGSRRTTSADLPDLPPNVCMGSYDYVGMRQFYSTALSVVVPFCQRDAPAGVTVIQEAIAMDKAMIATGTGAKRMSCTDPRNNERGLVEREWWPGFLDALVFLKHLDLYQQAFMLLLEMPMNFAVLYNIFWITLRSLMKCVATGNKSLTDILVWMPSLNALQLLAIRGERHPELVY